MQPITTRDAFKGATFTPGMDWETCLRNQTAKSSLYCRCCVRGQHSSHQTNDAIVSGTITFLPDETSVPLDSSVGRWILLWMAVMNILVSEFERTL